MENKNTSINIGTILTIVFVVLKLAGKITWSWWWVLSPVWIGWGIAAVLMIVLAIMYKK